MEHYHTSPRKDYDGPPWKTCKHCQEYDIPYSRLGPNDYYEYHGDHIDNSEFPALLDYDSFQVIRYWVTPNTEMSIMRWMQVKPRPVTHHTLTVAVRYKSVTRLLRYTYPTIQIATNEAILSLADLINQSEEEK